MQYYYFRNNACNFIIISRFSSISSIYFNIKFDGTQVRKPINPVKIRILFNETVAVVTEVLECREIFRLPREEKFGNHNNILSYLYAFYDRRRRRQQSPLIYNLRHYRFVEPEKWTDAIFLRIPIWKLEQNSHALIFTECVPDLNKIRFQRDKLLPLVYQGQLANALEFFTNHLIF